MNVGKYIRNTSIHVASEMTTIFGKFNNEIQWNKTAENIYCDSIEQKSRSPMDHLINTFSIYYLDIQ